LSETKSRVHIEKRLLLLTSERGAVTALSAFFMSLTSGFAGVTFFNLKSKDEGIQWFWLLTAVAFCFFALDELLGFHEALGILMGDKLGEANAFKTWNDLVVIVYGVIAVLVLFFSLPQVLRFPKVAGWLATGFGFYCIHTLIDSMVQPRTPLSAILEESAKLFSAESFAFAMFHALLASMLSNEKPFK
jgi:hypothetical protein